MILEIILTSIISWDVLEILKNWQRYTVDDILTRRFLL